MNKSMTALNARLRRENDEQRLKWNRREPAGLPPMPVDPMQCRWCGGRRKLLIVSDRQSDFCPNLCAKNDLAPFLVDCDECGRPFHTGKHNASMCPTCDERVMHEREEHGPRTVTRDDWAERRRHRG